MGLRSQRQPKEEAVTTHEISTAQPSGLAELKQAHRRIWASGSYARVAERIVDDVPPRHLLERVRIERGMEVLDLATGTGNVAIRAAQLGARVTGVDLTPELFGRARERAAAAGVEVEWIAGDVEDLPFEDDRFDVVVSTFGIQFAPRHEVAAREAVRVTRPGGTIGLINWTPQGHIGRLLKAVGARMPKPPAYASPPPLWGDEAHVRALLGDSVTDVVARRQVLATELFASPEAWRDYWKTVYGPTIAVYRYIADDPEKVAGLDRDLVTLAARYDRGTGSTVMDWEYLLFTAHRQG
jgi:ubiquinone/menaquinone biosynthesis C-methylase UbiE